MTPHLGPGTSGLAGGVWAIVAGSLLFVGPLVLVAVVGLVLSSRRTPQGTRTAVAQRRFQFQGTLVGSIVGVPLVWMAAAEYAPVSVLGGYVAATLVWGVRQARPSTGRLRTASLRPRNPLDHVPLWVTTLACSLAFATSAINAGPLWTPAVPWWKSSSVATQIVSQTLSIQSAGLVVASTACLLLGRRALTRLALVPEAPSSKNPSRDLARSVASAVVAIEFLVLAATLIFASGAQPHRPATGHDLSRVLTWAALAASTCALIVWARLGWRRPQSAFRS